MNRSSGPVPTDATTRPSYLAELERLPDGSLRICLSRNGHIMHREWVDSERRGRRRVVDLICSAVDVDPRTPGRTLRRCPVR